MRRRTLLGGGNIEYVFSAQTTSLWIDSYNNFADVNIISTANGSNIGYSVVSYDGTVVTGVTTAATRVTIYYSANPKYDQTRSGNVVLKQNDSNETITINVSQYEKMVTLDYACILLDGTSGSRGSMSFDSNVSFYNVPDWADVTYSSGKINVTALSTNSASTARYDIIALSVGSQMTYLGLIQLPSDYHSRSYVSMVGLNWAIKNVGASSVQDYGNYYMYGKGSRTYNSSDIVYIGNEDPLASSADTATQVMGSGWRMPTKAELGALTATTNYYWVTYNGVNGGVFYSSGNVLFFPGAGDYYEGSLENNGTRGFIWSSTPHASINMSYHMDFYRSESRASSSVTRKLGFSVRGVQA